ncbi:membrane protein [Mycobacterium phage Brocalys]|uniref:Uncharacterized protein n=17 Tax=Cheoctovirus TaxID=1623281 RepID=G1DUU1_9CAUD|nr:membrane protein [Mycobacterium phage Saal]YP_009189813.1 membrane protein [Mycobacterium phage Cabrinians]YP_009303925.1 membrane protein [Mycobacterium phage Brocalys]YP_009608172.1 membrane protein [Mycobacterium phage ShiLan]YP_009954778.1 membrane protein [Mycobacterium phage Blexus]YP_009954884.1 membrane protein [Mycobacterium phage BobaPhett]YP_009955200.1 membrane protein [Mycobacterium phage Burwell21]YP_009957811.1 membrane protein [Mycobacterium phage Gorge]YP_009959255.1 mem
MTRRFRGEPHLPPDAKPNAAVDRSIRYASQVAELAAADMWETLTPPRRATRIADELERTDWGFGLGLLAGLGAAVAAMLQLWWLAAPLLAGAFVLCWWFG